jgi:GTP-binding protein
VTTFIDRVVLHLSAGHGGRGCVSVRREKFKPLGGPDGGNGGNGGDIVLVAEPRVTTLLDYHRRPHRNSESGNPGMGDSRHGASAPPVELPVPIGTVVSDAQGNQIADLNEAGMSVVVAPGGRGGLGNQALATPKRKAPGFALLGTHGFEGDIVIELKTVADVALVGFPSAGKSSLIAAMSQARPKIADYPFTTLQPNLGVVEAGDVRFTIADVPGLIEGASEGKGLGLDFLRHIERCSVLVHVIDLATMEPGRDPMSDFDVIRGELAAYPVPEGQVPLLERPQVIALNKLDVPDSQSMASMVRGEFEAQGFNVFEVSAVSRDGLRELGFRLGELVAQSRREKEAELAQRPRTIIRPQAVDELPFIIRREGRSDGDLFRIVGEKPEKFIEQTDFENDEAVGYLSDRLAALGLDDALFEAGATPGDTVVIGEGAGREFDWEPTVSSAGYAALGSRGSDERLMDSGRKTRREKREIYYERMDQKAAARAELEDEREAGMWSDD